MILIVFLLSFLVVFLSTPFWAKLAEYAHIVDDPRIDPERRVHKKPIPLVGGVAIGVTLFFGVLVMWYFGLLTQSYITDSQVLGLMAGIVIILIGGVYDDKYKLPNFVKLLLPIAAATAVVAGGVGVNFITNPAGGVIRLDAWQWPLWTLGGQQFYFNWGADLFTIGWLTLMMYTTKMLDGLDGLVTGITVIGATILFFLSLSAIVLQFDTAYLLAIIAGVFAGFWPYNWQPARFFLGDAGSLLAGYVLGVVAIIAGGKIATTVLVLGLPVIDALWVVFNRVVVLRKSPLSPDRNHLHFRLLDAGFSVKQAVLLFYGVSLLCGGAAIFMLTRGKTLALIILVITCILCLWLLQTNHKKYGAHR